MTDDTDVTVLIVEDEQQIADGYASILRDRYTVKTAYSGEQALETIDDDVDVVLLDRMMPGLSGRETLTEFREAGFECPVAMVTAKVPDFDVIEMGFDDYLTKPVDVDELEDTVERLIALGRLDPSVRAFVADTIKQASLEANKPSVELSTSEDYQGLRDRLSSQGAELGDISAAMTDEEFELVLQTIVRNLGDGQDGQDSLDQL
ncbi:response regulator receiver protein [Halorhabdus utahensis DSM 12940]|uniref:Response regulator receiver protein n=1 Tax=Halorhabdus utahensis (strain DSM 12940 / JCM 11049 / AX-2) TaxID=519442 RepID=C7NRK9_HALUD|nr:response regulator [Halorhabdus utahensis]ACV11945.1 response regulator receiver protein [Halorhabdus utahensis DSM 12940]